MNMLQSALFRLVSRSGVLLLTVAVLAASVAENNAPARNRAAAEPFLERRETPKTTSMEGREHPEPHLLPIVRQKDIPLPQQLLADSTLRALPSHCRDNLKNFYVQTDDPAKRGLGGKTTIILYGNVPDEEFIGLLIHECAHVTHGNLQGNAASGDSPFRDGKQRIYADSPLADFFAISWTDETTRKKGSAKADFVTGYAQSDAFEDFAETFAMYVLHRPALRAQAANNRAVAAKLAWMDTVLPLPETAIAKSAHPWSGTPPWDATRLPFTLSAAIVLQ